MNSGHFSNATAKLVLVGFLIVGGFFLVTEHRAHLFGVLPFLLFLACPLMHLLGHHHGGHEAKPDESGQAVKNDTAHRTGH